jgi:hypothetical protein
MLVAVIRIRTMKELCPDILETIIHPTGSEAEKQNRAEE